MTLSEHDLLKLINSLSLDTQQDDLDVASEDWLPSSSDEPGIHPDAVRIEGKVIRIDPAIDSPMFLEAASNVAIKVNGEPRTGRITVTSKDEIEWDVPLPTLFTIEIPEDKMSAWFHLQSKEQNSWKLNAISSEPNRIRLEAEEDPERIARTLHIRDIEMALHDKGLYQFNLEAIKKELEAPTFKPVVIAQGIRPVPSVDATLELLFKETIESSFHEINGQVDFRNHMKIPSAKAGDVIARKIPSRMGSRGVDIFGQFIDPAPPKDIVLVPKQHVEITPLGEVVALREGRPRVTGERIKFVSVNPLHIVPSDVDLKTGNIFFSGDVAVYGDVTDGMAIEALGNVYVSGAVYNATITATGSIQINGNVIGGKLYSGHFGVLFNRIFNFSKKLNENLQQLRNGAKVLMDALEAQGKVVPEGQAYQLLADTKFKEIPATAKEMLSSIATLQSIQQGQLEELKHELHLLLQPSCFTRLGDPHPFMNRLQQLLIDTSDSIQRCEEKNVVLDIPKCQLSTLMSNGDISIRQEGVVQSNLYAKENIIFYLKHAMCKGSTLEAGHTISAMIVGGTSGGACILKAGVKIMITKMYDGRVYIQRFSREILEPLDHTQFTLKDHRLVTEHL